MLEENQTINPLPASLEQNNANNGSAEAGNAGASNGIGLQKGLSNYEAEYAAREHKQQRLQIASLVLAELIGGSLEVNTAVAADRAIAAADALIERASRN